MKKTTLISLTTALIILFAAVSFAGPARDGKRQGGQDRMVQVVNQLSPEKRALFESIIDEHRKDVRPLRNTMWQKRTELKALSANPNTKPETLTAIVAEMADARVKLQEKGDALRARIKKEVGIDFPPSRFGQGRPGGKPGQNNPGGKAGLGAELDPDGLDADLAELDDAPGL